MYLKQAHIENNGPLKDVRLEFPIAANGLPKPVVLVGANGSGKTNLLSIVVDALFEAAATHYTDVVPGAGATQRNWFRIVGATTISMGAPGSFSILRFEHDGKSYLFKEKGGKLPAKDIQDRLATELKAGASWVEDGATKEFAIDGDTAQTIFDSGAYVYFPSSRSEAPNWLNRQSVPTATFDLSGRFTKRLGKPIYVEKSLDQFRQWLLALILEARADVEVKTGDDGKPVGFSIVGNWPRSITSMPVLGLANEILQLIIGDPTAKFVWLGRRSGEKLGIEISGRVATPSLDSLSAGQSTLLAIFGALLRYGDSGPVALSAQNISGICLVDEIDSHMHVDLQYRALPQLIKMFPKVQFILSSHSPLFALGMEKELGTNGVSIVEMPSGISIQAEAYTEFGRAFLALQETNAFANAITETAGASGKLVVLCEGETDPVYLRAAAELLQRTPILENVELEWIGAKDAGGRAFHTGKDALNHTVSMLRANSNLIKRDVLLLYDNDANKPTEDYGRIHVRSVPSNLSNSVVEAGIENLLPPELISDDMFVKIEKKKRGGGKTVNISLNKTKLCAYVCEQRRVAVDFEKFSEVLDMIETLVILDDPNVLAAKP